MVFKPLVDVWQAIYYLLFYMTLVMQLCEWATMLHVLFAQLGLKVQEIQFDLSNSITHEGKKNNYTRNEHRLKWILRFLVFSLTMPLVMEIIIPNFMPLYFPLGINEWIAYSFVF